MLFHDKIKFTRIDQATPTGNESSVILCGESRNWMGKVHSVKHRTEKHEILKTTKNRKLFIRYRSAAHVLSST